MINDVANDLERHAQLAVNAYTSFVGIAVNAGLRHVEK